MNDLGTFDLERMLSVSHLKSVTPFVQSGHMKFAVRFSEHILTHGNKAPSVLQVLPSAASLVCPAAELCSGLKALCSPLPGVSIWTELPNLLQLN